MNRSRAIDADNTEPVDLVLMVLVGDIREGDFGRIWVVKYFELSINHQSQDFRYKLTAYSIFERTVVFV